MWGRVRVILMRSIRVRAIAKVRVRVRVQPSPPPGIRSARRVEMNTVSDPLGLDKRGQGHTGVIIR